MGSESVELKNLEAFQSFHLVWQCKTCWKGNVKHPYLVAKSGWFKIVTSSPFIWGKQMSVSNRLFGTTLFFLQNSA